MRLDQFLSNAGCIPRRTQAKQACDEGLVEVDGNVARPATSVQVGQQITVKTGMRVRQYRILQLPQHPVPRKMRNEYSELLSSEPIDEVESYN